MEFFAGVSVKDLMSNDKSKYTCWLGLSLQGATISWLEVSKETYEGDRNILRPVTWVYAFVQTHLETLKESVSLYIIGLFRPRRITEISHIMIVAATIINIIIITTTVTTTALIIVTFIQSSLWARNDVKWFVGVGSFPLSSHNRMSQVLLLSSIYWWRDVGLQNFKPGI